MKGEGRQQVFNEMCCIFMSARGKFTCIDMHVNESARRFDPTRLISHTKKFKRVRLKFLVVF